MFLSQAARFSPLSEPVARSRSAVAVARRCLVLPPAQTVIEQLARLYTAVAAPEVVAAVAAAVVAAAVLVD